MEQQKLLWTILSAGILVLIILGAGMFFFLPSDSTGLAQNGKTTEWSKAATPAPAPEQKAPEVKKTPVQPAAPAPAQTQSPASKPEVKKTPVQTPAAKPTPAPATKSTTSTAQTPQQTQPKQTATTTPKATPAPATKPAQTTTQQSKPAATTTAQQAAKPAQTQAAKPAAAATAAKGSYWVQVGSYATTDAAEKTKQDLSAKGYKSSIQSITANGKTYHRVKIGPYASRSEVDTLLPKIKALPGMGDSFITTK
ncbi:MAG: SPOR domain-containing protein [Spirochaetia bacterium]|nr:SPOR domain-containing protein [Spirochaetia bacterium]